MDGPSAHLGHSANMGGAGTNNRTDNIGHGLSLGGLGAVTKRERSPSPSDCMSPDTINNPPSPADSSKLFFFRLQNNFKAKIYFYYNELIYYDMNLLFENMSL